MVFKKTESKVSNDRIKRKICAGMYGCTHGLSDSGTPSAAWQLKIRQSHEVDSHPLFEGTLK